MMSRDLLNSPGSSGTGRMAGVAVAIVIDNNDPQGLGRVRVKFPAISDDEIGHWARIAVLMAGVDRGTFFLPEIGDEVLVAFEQGDIAGRTCWAAGPSAASSMSRPARPST